MDPLDLGETVDAGSEKADIPSCLGCRRRKLKCSREQPTCSHCTRLDTSCVYDLNKTKPGVKAGAVNSLSRRLDALEDALLKRPHEDGCCHNGQPDRTRHSASGSHDVVEVLSMLTSELQKLNSKPQPLPQPRAVGAFQDYATVSPTASQSSSRYTIDRHDGVSSHGNQPRKRRRVDSCGNPNVELSLPLEENAEDITKILPAPDLLEDVINVYFDVIQPWVPILHETQFRWRIHNQDHFPELVVILHAMVVAALRFVDNIQSRLGREDIEQRIARSRRVVILTSMGALSVENLQAQIILSFTDIGSGEAMQAWPIIGSLTRTVEYLQLSVEADHLGEEPLLKPLPIIPAAKDWTQEEERRRVFWTIFCLDRFCSITSGWNTSLTSDNVRRRLPADGGLWHKEDGVTTPYFGIWDKSVAKIGNSIAFLPGNYPSPEHSHDAHVAAPVRSGAQAGLSDMNMTTIGAFAYCIEATESLSRITTYFLQQKIDFQDKSQVSDWLTRFKELDLRLVHWKMFLPQRWKDSNISRQPDFINMDPNLTLAHVTHNTSMILLHQRIAYPDARWSSSLRLPSFCSAETCQVAAVETTSITQKYLKYTSGVGPVGNQYAFCVFISARVLLSETSLLLPASDWLTSNQVHWRHYKAELAPEFWHLVQGLDEMARRWAGPVLQHTASQSLAGTYAEQLRSLHSRCDMDPQFEIDVLGYSGGTAQSSQTKVPASGPRSVRHQESGTHPSTGQPAAAEDPSDNSQDLSPWSGRPVPLNGVGPRTNEMNLGSADIGQSGLTPGIDLHQERLSAISHMLMDEDFMAMDRIISLDDMIFGSSECNPNGMAWTSSHEHGPLG